MTDNKSKIDRLNDLLPSHFNTKSNPNWKAIIDALGSVDQDTADLVAQVRQQFFVKTASRPYIDVLAANNLISRPKLVGMDDPSFRQYIPVLSYKPKQVKLIIDELLDIFFFKESTTAFVTSSSFSPFVLQDGWELTYLVDELYSEQIKFSAADFTNINAATADEIVASINRQTTNSYATAYYDSITKNTFIKIFTNTVGSKGSLRITGGRANIALMFDGFNTLAGNGSDTQWTVSKVGDVTTFRNTAGSSPGLNNVQVGDVIISNLPNNQGSFPITSVDIGTNSISFVNLFSTPGVYTETSALDVKFITPNKYVAYTNSRRAMTWEVSSGEIIVEMPTSPPVVKRSLIGSWHINGALSNMTNRISNTSLTVQDASNFPQSGNFKLQELNEIATLWLTPTESTATSFTSNSRFQLNDQQYHFTSRAVLSTTGNTVAGSNQIQGLGSVAGLAVGQQISMAGVPPYAAIEFINGSTVTMTFPSSLTANASPVTFLGNTLQGITPDLPAAAGLNQYTLSSLTRSSNIVTATTTAPHNYQVGEYAIIGNSSGILISTTTGDVATSSNQLTNIANTSGIGPGMLVEGGGIPAGTKILQLSGNTVTMTNSATSTITGDTVMFLEDTNLSGPILTTTTNTFTYFLIGSDGSATVPGTSRVERSGLANAGSQVLIVDAVPNTITRITGSYAWDLAAPFVLSKNTATISDPIAAGKIIRLLNTSSNTIDPAGGFLIFDYGLNTQEGPIRYLYKPTDDTIALDPSYVFQQPHIVGSSIVSIDSKGPHQMSGLGTEYPPYVTNPSDARFILEDLIRSVKSAGIFVNFLIRYPEQLYGLFDVYDEQGLYAGAPFQSNS